MATLKFNDIKKMTEKDREKKIKEFKLELIKAKVGKQGNKTKNIKKIIARILTFNNSKSGALNQK